MGSKVSDWITKSQTKYAGCGVSEAGCGAGIPAIYDTFSQVEKENAGHF
jgi:hypothetical protein